MTPLCVLGIFQIFVIVLCPLGQISYVSARHHTHRHQQIKATGMDECADPPDLKSQLGEWGNSEFPLTKQSVDYKGEDSDSDDKWTLPADPEMVKICSEPPATSVNSSVMQRSLCPWHWRLNHDDTREPKLISEAVCLCRKSRGTSGSYCMPIQREMPILKRVACNPVTKRYEYVKAVKMVTVGCHSVLPRTQRALPLSRYYSQTQSVEI